MTENIQGVLFTDGKDRIFFHPPKEYSDGHGFHHRVDIVSGPFSGAIEASSYVQLKSFDEFRDQLINLHKTLKGDAVLLPHCYENLEMSLKGDGLGHVTVKGTVAAGPWMQSHLTFEFSIDQTHLPEIIKAIDRLFLS